MRRDLGHWSRRLRTLAVVCVGLILGARAPAAAQDNAHGPQVDPVAFPPPQVAFFYVETARRSVDFASPRDPEPRASLFIERFFAGFGVGAAALLLAEVAEPDAENLPFALYPGAAAGGVAIAAAAREGVRVGQLALGTALGAVPWLIAWNLDRHGQETSLLFGVIGVVTVPLGAAVGQGLGAAMPNDQGLRKLPPYAPR